MDPLNVDDCYSNENVSAAVRARLDQPPGNFSEGPASIRGVRSPEGVVLHFRIDYRGRSYVLCPLEAFLMFEGDYEYQDRSCPQTDDTVSMAVGPNGQWWHIYHTRYGGAMFEHSNDGTIEVSPWWARGLGFWIRDEDVELIDPNSLAANP